MEPVRPVLGRAVAAATGSTENADINLRCLDTRTAPSMSNPTSAPNRSPDLLDQAEHDLALYATTVLRPEDPGPRAND